MSGDHKKRSLSFERLYFEKNQLISLQFNLPDIKKAFFFSIFAFLISIIALIIKNKMAENLLLALAEVIIFASALVILNNITVPLRNVAVCSRLMLILQGFGNSLLIGIFVIYAFYGEIGSLISCLFLFSLCNFLEHIGWKEMNNYLENRSRLSELISFSHSKELREAVLKIKKACIIMIFSFLVIPIIIGIFYFMIGFKNLGVSLEKIEKEPPLKRNVLQNLN